MKTLFKIFVFTIFALKFLNLEVSAQENIFESDSAQKSSVHYELKKIPIKNPKNPRKVDFKVESKDTIIKYPSFDLFELCGKIDFSNIKPGSNGLPLIAAIKVSLDENGNVLQCAKYFEKERSYLNNSEEWSNEVLKHLKDLKFIPAQSKDGAIPVTAVVIVSHNSQIGCF